jgi:FecR protein
MTELQRLGRDVRRELGEPSPAWLRDQRQRLRQALAAPSAPRTGARRWALAGALALALAVGWVAFAPVTRLFRRAPAPTELVLNAPSSARRIALEDGSALTLEPLSLARVSRSADATRCGVELGTVAFEVAPQMGRVFSVVVGALEIRVVGTRFSVRRDSAGIIEVRVEHGVVRVQAPNPRSAIELEAGDRLWSDGAALNVTHPGPAAAARTPEVVPGAPVASAEPEKPAAVASSASASPDWQTLYRDGRHAMAIAAAKRAGIDRLLATLDAAALAELADAARLSADPALALRVFAALTQRYPASPQAADATFLSGRIHAASAQTDVALADFERYLALNARGRYALEATGRLVELYAIRGDKRAKRSAERYLEQSPNGPYQRLCHSVLAAP